MSKQLSGKNIIVTGAGSPTGIGAGVADGLAERGANVVVADIDLKAAEDVAGKIATRHSVKTIAVKVDVSNRAEVEALVAKTVDAFGQLDVMFNNAGIIEHASFLEITESGWHKLMNVNALGVLIGIQVAAKQMIAQGNGGKIINTSSIASRQGYPAFAHYSASKWAVAALSQAAARQFAEHRINVNCIAPGVVKTALWDQLDREFINKGLTKEPEQAINKFSLGIPLGRYSVAKDLVGTAAFGFRLHHRSEHPVRRRHDHGLIDGRRPAAAYPVSRVEYQHPVAAAVDEQQPAIAVDAETSRISDPVIGAERTQRRALVIEGEERAVTVAIGAGCVGDEKRHGVSFGWEAWGPLPRQARAAYAGGTSAATRSTARTTAGLAEICSYQRAILGVFEKSSPANSRRHSQPKWVMSAMEKLSPAAYSDLAKTSSRTASTRSDSA